MLFYEVGPSTSSGTLVYLVVGLVETPLLIKGFEPFPLENQHIEHANSDGRVSEIEDGAEENEMPIGAEKEIGKPRGVFLRHINEGEIKHVDHAPMQPIGIAAAIGEEGRDLGVGAFAENAPVKDAIDDVAYGSRSDERNAEQHAELGVFPRQANQNPKQGDNGHNPENAQGQFQETAAAKPAESHAVVLDEQQIEPTPDDRDFLPEGHTRLDPNLEDLVEEQNEKNHHKRPDEAVVALLFHFLFSLASKQRVVMGTQRSLSFGMSLPVSQHTP